MAKVTFDIQHVAKLANLNPSDKQLKKFAHQLSSILDYVNKIQQLPTTGVPETSQITDLTDVTRKDEVDSARMLSQAEALSNARTSHNGYFVVKSIF